MKQLTIDQIFARYPLKPSKVAIDMRRSREWIMRLTTSTSATGTINDNLAAVQAYLNDLGQKLTGITLTGSASAPGIINIADFFNEYPFTISSMAGYSGFTRAWFSLIVCDNYKSSAKAREKQIKKIESLVHVIGHELSTIQIKQLTS